MKIEQLLMSLYKRGQEIVTTKELNELGFSTYTINNVLDKKELVRIAKGVYEVPKVKKYNQVKIDFKNLIQNLKKERWEISYETLHKICENEDADSFYRKIYFYGILLQKLLMDTYDFSFLNNPAILEKTSPVVIQNQHSYYQNLYEAYILEGNYKLAQQTIDELIDYDKTKKLLDEDELIALKMLVSSVLKKEEEEKKRNEIRKNGLYTIVKDNLSTRHFDKVYHYLMITKKVFPEEGELVALCIRIVRILESVITSQKPIATQTVSYNSDATATDIFKQAVYFHDFKKAFFYGAKFEKENKNKKLAKLARYTVTEIMNLNLALEENKKKKLTIEPSIKTELPSLQQESKKPQIETKEEKIQNPQIEQEIEEKKEPQKEKIEEPEKVEQSPQEMQQEKEIPTKTKEEVPTETKEEIPQVEWTTPSENQKQKKLTFDSEQDREDYIYKCIEKRNYEDLEKIIFQLTQDEVTRFNGNVKKLLKIYLNIKKNDILPEKNDHFYQTSESDTLRRFYEALSKKDYNYAKELAEICIENFRSRGNDTKEMEGYRYLIIDIVEEIDNKKEKKELKSLIKKIAEYSNENIYNNTTFEQREEIYNGLEIVQQQQPTAQKPYGEACLNILESIDLYRENQIEIESFATMDELKENNYLVKEDCNLLDQGFFYEQLQLVLKYGLWEEAYEMINERKNFAKEAKQEMGVYAGILPNFLKRIHYGLVTIKKEPISKEGPVESEEENEVLEKLNRLKFFLKRRDFTAAYFIYDTEDFSFIKEDSVKEILDIFLPLLSKIERKEAQEILDNINMLQKRGDFKEAKKQIDEYNELTNKKMIHYNLDYALSYIEAVEKNSNQVDFAVKEQGKDFCNYLLSVGELSKALEIICKYIEENKEDPFGYQIRAQILSRLNRQEERNEDIQKNIELLNDPTSYYLLGEFYKQKEDFSKALEYFKLTWERNVTGDVSILNSMKECYQELEEKDHVEEMEKKIRFLSKIKKEQ